MQRHQDPQLASAERADDEKTIRDEQPGQEFSEKKDMEAAKPSSSIGPASVHEETDVDLEDDDFPDGGLKAWSVVAGVCPSMHTNGSSLADSCHDHV